jgi:salicylate hydroxylase
VHSVDLETPSITLADGSTVSVDLIVGADGTGSVVRRAMYPNSERLVSKDYVIQGLIPREVMYRNDITRTLYDDPATRLWMGPGAYSVTSTAPNQSVYDMQIILLGYADSGVDPHPEKLIEPLENLQIIGNRLDEWSPLYRDMFAEATNLFKWRIVEAPPLPTALSKHGKVIIIGDAYHGHDPSAGFGSALSLEDGATLALLLSRATAARDIPQYLRVYDRLQHERSNAIRKYSAYVGRFYGMNDGAKQVLRDKNMKAFDPNRLPGAKPSPHARYATAEWQSYMDDYDPDCVAAEALRELSSHTVDSRL